MALGDSRQRKARTFDTGGSQIALIAGVEFGHKLQIHCAFHLNRLFAAAVATSPTIAVTAPNSAAPTPRLGAAGSSWGWTDPAGDEPSIGLRSLICSKTTRRGDFGEVVKILR
jgi:hypothetical protein